MHFLHEAQLPFAAVCTPIFSRSELRPPSSSSILSVCLLIVETSGAEVPPLLPLFTRGAPSVFLSTDCFFVEGSKSYKIKIYIYYFFLAYQVIFEVFASQELTPCTYEVSMLVNCCPLLSAEYFYFLQSSVTCLSKRFLIFGLFFVGIHLLETHFRKLCFPTPLLSVFVFQKWMKVSLYPGIILNKTNL